MNNGTCSQPDCDTPAYCRGLCDRHYQQGRSAGTLELVRPRRPVTDVDSVRGTCTCPIHGEASTLRTRVRKSGKTHYTCRTCESVGSTRGVTVPSPASKRAARIRSKYGISVEEVEIRTQAQQGLCLICGDELGDRAAIDHDHGKGHVRGILCRLCNLGLGHFRDNPRALERAAKYLRRYRNAS